MSLSRSGDQLHVDPALVAGLDADLAAVEIDAQQDRAGRVERRHGRASGLRLRAADDAHAVGPAREGGVDEIGEIDAAEEGRMQGHAAPLSRSG